MTTLSAILASQIDAESPYDTVIAGQMANNWIAALEGDASASAHRIQTAALEQTGGSEAVTAATIRAGACGQPELAANSVGQSEVKTTYQEVSASGGSEFTASGGVYCIGHTMQGFITVPNTLRRTYGANATTYAARWVWNAESPTYDGVRLYYINSSPPYDLGDGEIPMFVYALIDNVTGEIVATSVSPDPTWAYNGKTNIVPSRYAKDGRIFRERKDMSAVPFTMDEAKLDPVKLQEYMTAFNSADVIEEEITQTLKNADMNEFSHPWIGNDLTGKTVALLDPMSSVMQDFLEMREHDNYEGACELINKGYFKIGNTHLKRSGPSGILIPSVKWKNTP